MPTPHPTTPVGPATDGPSEPISDHPVRVVERPLLRMRWEEVVYLHWEVAPEQVSALLPAGLQPDLHDGRAYVGLVPFRMAGIALGRRGPRLPWGRFPETNVRTYVVGPDGGRGVYFHSLDITRLVPVLAAQLGYRLPYAWSRMRSGRRGTSRAFLAQRRWPAPRGTCSRVVVELGARLDGSSTTSLDRFLSARWSLYAAAPSGQLLRAYVDHPPWPLREARLTHLDDQLLAAAGYPPPPGPPVHVRYGGDVEVRVAPPVRVDAGA